MTAMTGKQNRQLDSEVVGDDGEDSKECQKTFDRCCGEFLMLSTVFWCFCPGVPSGVHRPSSAMFSGAFRIFSWRSISLFFKHI